MEKKLVKNLILGAIIFTFAMFFLQVISPLQASAENQKLNWDNPNDGKNPYKFKAKDFLNSQMIMQVVGCTGVVDKVSAAAVRFIKNTLKSKTEKLAEEKLVETCASLRDSAGLTAGGFWNMTISTALIALDCGETQKTKDKTLLEQMAKAAETEATAQKREECFNGIAYTLAKNQLTAMTRNTVNWVNSGFNGDPMYVQNITSLTNRIERNVLEREINKLSDPNRAYPYGTDFSRSVINSYKTGASFRVGFDDFTDGLVSDLSAFLNIPPTYDNTGYYGNTGDYEAVGSYGLETTKTAQQRAKEANEAFANDFAVGGWNGYMALTQRDQNNSLGFTMLASQSLADQESQKIEKTKKELSDNSGFLSQKKCVLWQEHDVEGKPVTRYSVSDEMDLYVYNKNPSSSGKDKCVKDVVMTPGEIIKDKISTSLGSAERQLELADDINSVLNSVFSYLIDKLQNQGLASLSSEQYAFSNSNMGVGADFANSIDPAFGEVDPAFSGGYANGSFDLTRDLGNTYIYNARKSLGKWDAKDNTPELYPNTPPGNSGANVSYTVSVAGNTKLIDEGFNGWAVGDRAFWSGSEWQNWKMGEANPIKKRGVIQIQKDYVVAAKEMLKKLPTIMPKIGELDYCIPGPNPNWNANTSDADIAFQEYANTLTSGYNRGSFLKRDNSEYSIAKPGEKEYENYKSIFRWTTPNWWKKVTLTEHWVELNIMGNWGPERNDAIEDKNQNKIDSRLMQISNDSQVFTKLFGQQMDYLYGKNSLMLKPYIENEATGEFKENKSYLPMAESGLNITKNILSYNDDITDSMQRYQDDIIQANSNVYKLDAIRKRVNEIIKEAQDHRDAKLLEIIRKEKCDTQYNKCLSEIAIETTPTKNFSFAKIAIAANYSTTCDAQYSACMSAPITAQDKADYKEKYKDCLAEENITYFDENDIMGGTGGEDSGERCHNGLDDDLDKYVDLDDRDCEEYLGGNGGNGGGDVGYCNEDVTISNSINKNTASCGSITTEAACNGHIYYQKNKETSCIWSEDGGGGTGGTSLHGCKIKQGDSHFVTQENNTHCDLRTVEECTDTPYYSNNKQYTCEYLPI